MEIMPTQTRGMRPSGRALNLFELPEYALQLVRWDATPGVRNNNLDSDIASVAQAGGLFVALTCDRDVALHRVLHCCTRHQVRNAAIRTHRTVPNLQAFAVRFATTVLIFLESPMTCLGLFLMSNVNPRPRLLASWR